MTLRKKTFIEAHETDELTDMSINEWDNLVGNVVPDSEGTGWEVTLAGEGQYYYTDDEDAARIIGGIEELKILMLKIKRMVDNDR